LWGHTVWMGSEIMIDYKNIRTYFSVFLGNDIDAYGETYPEVVDSSIDVIGAIDNDLIDEIDKFLAEYPTNELAGPAMNLITENRVGDCAGFPPTLIDFLTWLSAYLKQKRDE